MKLFLKFILLLFLTGYFPAWAADKSHQLRRITISPRQLSVDKALKIAYQNRPSQKEFDFLIKAGKNKQLSALSGYLPQLNFQSRIGKVNRAVLLPEKQVYLEGKQLLLTFSGPIDRYRIARQDTAIDYTQKLFDQDSIRLETEKSLLELWNIQDKYDFIVSLQKSSEMVFQKDKHQEQLGLLDTNVWLMAVAQYAQSTAQIEKYTDELNIALTNVERSLGIIIPQEIYLNQKDINIFIADSIITAQQHDANFYYQQALLNRKELQTLDEKIIREEYVEASYAKGYLPDVYLFGQVNYYDFKPLKRAQQSSSSQQAGAGATNRFVDWRVGLEFNWNFDGFGNAFNAEASDATTQAYQVSRLDTVQQIKKEVYTVYDTLQSSIKDLYAQKAKFKQADNELILRLKQYEIGEISYVELTEAQTNWEQARYELITLKKQTATQYRELLYKSGYPDNLS